MRSPRRRVDVFLAPGELTVHTRPANVKTILGSCVAVCVCDPVARVGGVNHFLLARPGSDDYADTRYGCVATPRLIECVCQAGATRHRLQAAIIGGAHPLVTNGACGGPAAPDRVTHAIGAENTAVALALLAAAGVHVVHQDTGGPCGRKLLFNTGTGELLVRKLRNWSEAHPAEVPAT